MKYCPFCGSGLDDEMIFCPKCGRRFRSAHESVETETHETEPPHPEAIETFFTMAEEDSSPAVAEDTPRIAIEQTDNDTQIIVQQETRKKSKKAVIIGIIIAAIILATAVFLCTWFLQNKADPNVENNDTVNNADNSESAISTAAKSVLFLETYDDDGNLVATASGFIARDQTTLITNYHVIDGAYRIVAFTPNKESSVEVKTLLTYDPVLDLAILKCAGDIGVAPLVLGDSDSVHQGDSIYAVGYPLGVAHTLSNGVVGSRYIDDNGVDTIQITAAISSGSSGGTLFNEAGEVIGVICASYVEGQNLNLAIAINELRMLMESAVDPIALTEYYASQARIGKNAFNLAQDCGLVKSGEYYFYDSALKIYCYNSKTKQTRQVAQGQHWNVYKGRLYYYDRNSHKVFSCEFDGADVKEISLSPNQLKEPYGMVDMLIAHGLVFISAFNTIDFSTDFYIYDATTWEQIDSLQNVCNFSYHNDNLYVALRGGGIAEINMLTFEVQLFETSCSPWIRGISDDGKIYYIDEDLLLENGFYYIDTVVGEEVCNVNYARRSGNGKGWDIWVVGDTVYLAMRSQGANETYRICSNGELQLFNNNVMMTDGGFLPELNYYYAFDGTTIDMETGRIVGTWVFE